MSGTRNGKKTQHRPFSRLCQQSPAHYVFILDATAGRSRGWRFPVISQCFDTQKTRLLIVSSNNSIWKKIWKMGMTSLGDVSVFYQGSRESPLAVYGIIYCLLYIHFHTRGPNINLPTYTGHKCILPVVEGDEFVSGLKCTLLC